MGGAQKRVQVFSRAGACGKGRLTQPHPARVGRSPKWRLGQSHSSRDRDADENEERRGVEWRWWSNEMVRKTEIKRRRDSREGWPVHAPPDFTT